MKGLSSVLFAFYERGAFAYTSLTSFQ